MYHYPSVVDPDSPGKISIARMMYLSVSDDHNKREVQNDFGKRFDNASRAFRYSLIVMSSDCVLEYRIIFSARVI